MMCSTSIAGASLGLIMSLATTGFGEFFTFVSRNPVCVSHMIMLGTASTVGVYFIFYIIDHHGPVTVAIALLVQKIISVYMSAICYNNTVTAAASGFAFLTFMAVLARPLMHYYLDDPVVPLKTGTLRRALVMTSKLRAQMGHEVQSSATVLLAAARLKAALIERDPKVDKDDSMVLASKSIFNKFQNGSGGIDKDGLGRVLSSLGHSHTSEELEAMMCEFGVGGDGCIDFTKFSSMLKNLSSKRDQEDVKEAFHVFDEDNSGSISADKLRHVMENIGEKLSDDDISKILQKFSHSHSKSGQITFSDFVKIVG
jgi:calmodulin